MNITTTFDIGQVIFLAQVSRKMGTRDCEVCGGRGKLKTVAEDGSEHDVTCPMGQFNPSGTTGACRYGRVDVKLQHLAHPIRPVRVGQVKIEYGGLAREEGEFSNMGVHERQTFEIEESVMCYETGIGSGNVWRTKPMNGEGGGYAIFAEEDEAVEWAAGLVVEMDAALESEADK